MYIYEIASFRYQKPKVNTKPKSLVVKPISSRIAFVLPPIIPKDHKYKMISRREFKFKY